MIKVSFGKFLIHAVFSHIQTLSHIENGCDVIAYFMLGRTETRALLSDSRKICELLQEGMVRTLPCT